jgi:aryl-alcohol dehydrogenase-like predicted oxidoreductase
MGVDNQETLVHAAAMFDDFIERGGNAFDTAHIYDFDGGHCEQIFGDWMRSRGLRDEITLISKGAHTPNCTPDGMRQEFAESLERLQTNAADIYILHRDNLQVPVGEFVDVLNQHVQAGKFKIFGGSNWSLERVAEANAYASKNGLQGFSVVSNQLSLARMISPIWGGCVSAGETSARASLKAQGLALFAWSSQARGFFTDRAAPDRLEDEELVRCWYSPENFERRQRAIALAKEKNVSPINIALAWVLGQDFPCFSLIGPRSIRETASSMNAIDLVLSPAEMAWLDLAGERP